MDIARVTRIADWLLRSSSDVLMSNSLAEKWPVWENFIRQPRPQMPAKLLCLLPARPPPVDAGDLFLGLQPDFDTVGKGFELVPLYQGFKSPGIDSERHWLSPELVKFEGAVVVGDRRTV